jgi:hypothetical protein
MPNAAIMSAARRVALRKAQLAAARKRSLRHGLGSGLGNTMQQGLATQIGKMKSVPKKATRRRKKK